MRPKSCRKNDAMQNFAQHMTIFVDRPQEPGDVEATAKLRQSRPTRHQHQAAIPQFLEPRPRHQLRRCLGRQLHDHLVVARLGEQKVAAIAQSRDRRQRRLDQTRPTRLQRPNLQPKLLGAAKHARNVNRRAAATMPDLLGSRSDPMEPKHRHEDIKSRVTRIHRSNLHYRLLALLVARNMSDRQPTFRQRQRAWWRCCGKWSVLHQDFHRPPSAPRRRSGALDTMISRIYETLAAREWR